MIENRSFIEDKTRYDYDSGACGPDKGYAQIDTAQDASWYGQWANPTTRVIVAFIEGDLIVKLAESDDEFVAEIRAISAFEESQGRGAARIDPGLRKGVRGAFEALGLGDLLH